LHVGTVQQIRLILGPNNSIVLNGVTYPLSTPSADQSGLKILVQQTLFPGIQNEILLDFDANNSVVDEGNGSFKLKPVIRMVNFAINGAISGKIAQAGVSAYVTATSGGSSFSSQVSTTGNFMIMGLLPGMYVVTITPKFPYLPVTVNNVTVVKHNTTDVGTIVLQ